MNSMYRQGRMKTDSVNEERGAIMKTLILYATKHGATREIAQRIADRMDDAAIHDLGQSNIPDFIGFDCIVVGSSIYAGMIRKEAKVFLSQNADTLGNKEFGLFLSGMDATRGKDFFDSNIPQSILQNAKVTSFLGGIYDPQKAGLIERFIMKAAAKQSKYTDTIDVGKIEEFIEALQA